MLGRPSDAALSALARQARPSPPIEVPSFGPDHLRAGRQAFDEGRYGEALHHFGQRIAETPGDPWGWHGRGDALQLLGEAAGALEAYEAACARAPRHGLHHGGRANALRSLGRTEEAEQALAEALALDPSLTWLRPG